MIIKMLSALLLLSSSYWFICRMIDAAQEHLLDALQSSAQFSHLTSSRAMKPHTQVVQTKCKVQFSILHYSDLDSGEVFDCESVPLEINVGNGVVASTMKDLVQICCLDLAVLDLPELISDKHGI